MSGKVLNSQKKTIAELVEQTRNMYAKTLKDSNIAHKAQTQLDFQRAMLEETGGCMDIMHNKIIQDGKLLFKLQDEQARAKYNAPSDTTCQWKVTNCTIFVVVDSVNAIC
jgi:hypothetical protein